MSTIRYFEDVPHIVRYGMQDDKKELSWIRFWRNGVGFRVEVSHEDVRGTLFSQTWLEYLKEPSSFDPPLGPKEWISRWDKFCDCILTQCMPVLIELAPSSKKWVTLHDYLHTPSYKLKMVTNEATKDALPQIIEGPRDTPSYEHWPTAAANIKHLPANALHLRSEDLIVLNKEKNWRSPPLKVQAPDGQVFYFKTCQKTSKDGSTNTFTNHSIDTINMYSRLFKKALTNVNIPRMEGIVVTEPSPDIKDSSPSAGWSEDPRARHQDQQPHDETLIAGILVTYIAHSCSLAELLKAEDEKPTNDQREKWKRQVSEVVEFLHGQYITVGGRDGTNAWYFINQHSVRIAGYRSDTGSDAWLTASCTFHDLEGLAGTDAQTKFDEERAMDLKGIEKTFSF